MPRVSRLQRPRGGWPRLCGVGLALIVSFAQPAFGLDSASRGDVVVGRAPSAQGGAAQGWRQEGSSLRFEGQNLYGHIDGGAELFHEFGFDELLVRRYVKGEGSIDLEIYRMTSPEAALGIYLCQSGNGDPQPGIPARNVGGAYQISLLRGRAFIQINNFSGADSLLPTMVDLASACLKEFPAEEPDSLLANLPEAGRLPGSERLVRGPVALQSVFTFGPGDILLQEGNYFGVLARYRDGAGSDFSLLRIRYPDGARAKAAYTHLLANLDPYLQVLATLDESFVFEDYRQRYGIVHRDGALLELRFNLSQLPDGPPGSR